MTRLLASAVLAMLSVAAQATITTYEWTIDWTNRPDQSGTLVFDDQGDSSARTIVWDAGNGRPVPDSISGLPPGQGAFGNLSFDGSFVSGLRGCDDLFNACDAGALTRFGFTTSQFSLSGSGSALSYVYNYTGSDPASGCLNPTGIQTLPPNCFAIDGGVTTFAELTTPVPEPSTWALLLAGLAGLAMYGRVRRPALSQ